MKELIISNPAISEYGLPLHNLGGRIEEECIVIGILFLDSKLKYSILKMTDDDKKCDSYLEGSQLYIEDSFGKIPLVFNKSFDKLKLFCTGITLGFVGFKNVQNVFICKDVIFPKKLSKDEQSSDIHHPFKILFMNNILLNKTLENKIQAKVFIDYFISKVSNIVIFGDIFTNDETRLIIDDLNELLKFNKTNTEVCLVPGPNDPTNKDLPQDNFHSMLFDKKILNFLKTFKHPGEVNIGGLDFVFINKQIIDDLKKYYNGKIESDLDLLEELIKIRLTAPNCPDTMNCAPFSEKDPFLINNCDFLILGGCSNFEIREFNKIKLICLPDFSKFNSVVLFDSEKNRFEEVTLEI